MGTVERKLEDLGEVRGLVFGVFGEASVALFGPPRTLHRYIGFRSSEKQIALGSY